MADGFVSLYQTGEEETDEQKVRTFEVAQANEVEDVHRAARQRRRETQAEEPVDVTPAATTDEIHRAARQGVEQERRDQQALDIATNQLVAEGSDPDDAALAWKASARLGVPVSVMLDNWDFWKERAKRTSRDWYKVIENTPAAAEMMRDPTMARIVGRDFNELELWERQWLSAVTGTVRGHDLQAMNRINFRRLMGTDTREDLVRLAELKQRMLYHPQQYDLLAGPGSFILSAPGNIAEQAMIWGGSLIRAQKQALSGAMVGFLFGGVGALPGYKIGLKIGTGIDMAIQEAGAAYGEYETLRDAQGNPLDKYAVAGAALLSGIANGAIEFVSFGKVMRGVPLMRTLQKLGRTGMRRALQTRTMRDQLTRIGKLIIQNGLIEGFTEGLQEITQLAFAVAAGEAGGTGGVRTAQGESIWKGSGERIARSVGTGFQVGAGISTAGGAVTLPFDIRRARQSEQRAETLRSLSQDAQKSEVVQRLPQSMRMFVEQVQDTHGTIEEVTVEGPALQRFFQENGTTPEQIEAEAPQLAEAIERAAQTGEEVTVPIGDLADMALTEQFEQLIPDIRFHPNEFTAREAKVERENWESRFDQTEADVTDGDRIEDEITQQLIEANNLDPDVARKKALLTRHYIETAAAKTGKSVAEIYDEYGYEVRPVSTLEDVQDAGRRGMTALVEKYLEAGVPEAIEVTPEMEVDERAMAENLALRELPGFIEQAEIDIEGMTADEIVEELFAGRLFQEVDPQYQRDVLETLKRFPYFGDQLEMFEDYLGHFMPPATQAQIADVSELQMFSAVEQAVIDMNIPAWKQKKKVSSVIYERYQELLSAPDIYSTLDPRYVEREELAREIFPTARGADIWAKLKTMGLKKEELEYLGIEDWLMSKGDTRLTKSEVIQYVNEGGPRIDEIVADQAERQADDNIEWDSGEVWDEREAWEHDIDFWEGEIRHEDGDTIEERITQELYQAEGDALRETMIAEGIEDPSDGDVVERLRTDLAATIEEEVSNEIQELAEERAEANYNDNPLYIFSAQNLDDNLYIFGNDDQGYTVRVEDWRNSQNQIGDVYHELWDAKDFAYDWARDNDLLADEDNDFYVAKWPQYVQGIYDAPPSNYREIKITLPDVEGDFFNTTHFPDRNIVAFLRVTERLLPVEEQQLSEDVPKDFEVTVYLPDPQSEREQQLVRLEPRPATLPEMNERVSYWEQVRIDNSQMNTQLQVQANDFLKRLVDDEGQQLFMSIDDPDAPYAWQLIVNRLDEIKSLVGPQGSDRVWTPEEKEKAAEFYQQLYAYQFATHMRDEYRKARDEIGRAWWAKRRESIEAQTFHIDEFQSDWHQTGRKKGYKTGEMSASQARDRVEVLVEDYLKAFDTAWNKALMGAQNKLAELDRYAQHHTRGQGFPDRDSPAHRILIRMNAPERWHTKDAWKEALNILKDAPDSDKLIGLLTEIGRFEKIYTRETYGVADAPFKQDAWLMLGLRRAIIHAINTGAHYVSWPNAYSLNRRWASSAVEAMLTQYDKKMPSMMKKIMGSEPRLYTSGEHVQIHDDLVGYESDAYWVMEIPHEFAQQVKLQGLPLWQEGEEGARGWIDIASDTMRVTLTEKANLSTFLHESGHAFLEMHRRMIRDGIASDQMKADWDTLADWLGLEPGRAISREQHEQFARAFERYLAEGKAPSNALKEAFRSFRAWLLWVYGELTGLNVELTDEVRGVMDRMLATDEAISEAQVNMGLADMLAREDMPELSDKEYEQYRRRFVELRATAEEEMDKRGIAEVMRQKRRDWRQERDNIRDDLRKEIEKSQAGQALADLAAVPRSERIRQSDLGRAERRTLGADYYTPEGQPADVVADRYGYDSGQQMIEDLTATRTRMRNTTETANQLMAEKRGPIPVAEISEAALDALHSERSQTVLLTELRSLPGNENLGPIGPVRAALNAAAKDRIAETPLHKLNPNHFRRAELKAAQDFAGTSDPMERAIAKRRQVMNNALYREATEAIRQGEIIRRDLNRFASNKYRARLGKASTADYSYLDAVDDLLDGVDLRKRSEVEIRRRQSFFEFVQAAEARDEIVHIPPEFEGGERTNYRHMTIEQLRGLRDTISQIYRLADLKNKIRYRGELIEMDKLMDMFEAQAAHVRPVNVQKRLDQKTWGEDKIDWFRGWNADQAKVEFVLSLLDGGHSGVFQDAIIRPLADAQHARNDQRKDMIDRLHEILKGISPEQARRYAEKNYEFMGELITGQGILMLALNRGTESNLDKLARGFGWDVDQFTAELDAWMEAEDWALVETLWDLVGELGPQLQAVTKNLNGLAVPLIDPMPFNTRHGVVKGGYFPINYDPSKAGVIELIESLKMNGTFSAHLGSPKAQASAAHARTNYAAPLLLNLNVIAQHILEVTHFVHHAEPVIDVAKILRQPRFQKLIKEKLGDRYWNQTMQPWLKAIADDQVPDNSRSSVWNMIMFLKGGASVAYMGWRLTSAAKQLMGIIPTVAFIGPHWTTLGLVRAMSGFATDPLVHQEAPWRHAFEKSGEIRHAIENMDRDVRAVLNNQWSKVGLEKVPEIYRTIVVRKAFNVMGYAQIAVNVATWEGAYMKAQSEGMSEADSVAYADGIVRKAQSASAMKDLSQMQRKEANQPFTMFMSYFTTLHNALWLTFKQNGRARPWVAVWDTLWLLTFPVAVGMLIGKGWDAVMGADDDEDRELWEQYLAELATYYAGTQPLVRDVTSGAVTGMPVEVTSVGDGLAKFGRGLHGLTDGEISDKDIQLIGEGLGTVLRFPVGTVKDFFEIVRGPD